MTKLHCHKPIKVWATHKSKHLSSLALPKLDCLSSDVFFRSDLGTSGFSATSAQEKQVDDYLEEFIKAALPVLKELELHEALNIIYSRRNASKDRNRIEAAKGVAAVMSAFVTVRTYFNDMTFNIDPYCCRHWWVGNCILGYEENGKDTISFGSGDGYHRCFDDKAFPITEAGLKKIGKLIEKEEKEIAKQEKESRIAELLRKGRQ